MSPPPTVGVIIVSFNTRDLLRACLDSLRACTLPLRVIVIDNGSSDGSALLVRERFAEAELIVLEQNLGFAAANNVGLRRLSEPRTKNQEPRTENHEAIKELNTQHSTLNTQHSTLDYILLLNPDTVVHPGAIEALVGFMEQHPRVGAVGPRLLNPDGSLQPAAFRFPTLLMTALDLFPPGEVLPGRLYNSWWHGRYPQEHAGCAPFPIDHPLGACILVRQAVIAEVGPLDEQFFMYAEEVDWCYRMRRADWSIWQVPCAQVTHVGGAATRQMRARMLVALYESRLRFFRAHYSPRLTRWHSRIVRAGMLRALLLAWRDYARGTIDRAELRARLWAFGQVLGL